MRRHGTGRTGAGEGSGEQGFWPSYADMMSAVALILFFLMLVSYIQNLITGNDLQNTQEVLALTQSQVEEAEIQLAALSEELLQLLKPVCLEAVLFNKRDHCNEKPVHCNEE